MKTLIDKSIVFNFVRCLTTAILALAWMGPELQRAECADWTFRRSYFSHELPPEVATVTPQPISRSAYRPAIPNPSPGFSITGGYRWNRVVIQNGASQDFTVLRSDFVKFPPY